MVRPRKVPILPPEGKIGVEGACELLDVSKQTLYRYRREEDFPPGEMHLGYVWFDRLAVEAWRANRIASAKP